MGERVPYFGLTTPAKTTTTVEPDGCGEWIVITRWGKQECEKQGAESGASWTHHTTRAGARVRLEIEGRKNIDK